MSLSAWCASLYLSFHHHQNLLLIGPFHPLDSLLKPTVVAFELDRELRANLNTDADHCWFPSATWNCACDALNVEDSSVGSRFHVILSEARLLHCGLTRALCRFREVRERRLLDNALIGQIDSCLKNCLCDGLHRRCFLQQLLSCSPSSRRRCSHRFSVHSPTITLVMLRLTSFLVLSSFC